MTADTQAIESVLRQYGAAVSAGDLDAWIGLWAEDGRQMPPNAPSCIGAEAIRASMAPVFESMNLAFELISIDESRVIGDFGLTRCTYSIVATPKAGGDPVPVMPEGKALTLYERQADGGWKISYDCFNANAA
ncbi:MAG: SgcJ/EcaC family oxidoreductase [Pseudomonadota bacterium]